MGKVQSLLNEPDKALASFDKAIHLNRFCADAYFEQALLEETLNPLQAEQDYRCVLRINPSNTAAYNNLGSLLYKQSRTNEALEMYRQVVILNPKDKTALFNLATILEDVGDYQEAAGLYFNLLGQHQLEMQAHLRLVSLLTSTLMRHCTARKMNVVRIKRQIMTAISGRMRRQILPIHKRCMTPLRTAMTTR